MKHLGITLGGAVSLGTFEAGALYELFRALKQHNLDALTPDDQKIYIDVITGASAGGMTACIAVQKLLYDRDALDTPFGNALFIPWVQLLGLGGLLDMKADEPPANSILSSDLIESISKRVLIQPQCVGGPHGPPHPAAANKIFLGLAMSNLSGVDYAIPLASGGQFVYTRFQDEFVVPLSADVPADSSFDRWESIRNAAIGCGAFPFAFRIKDVVRNPTDYPGNAGLPPTLGHYAYTDGGTFQNEPLGLTKNLVDLLDKDHTSHDSRFYLFVAPNLRASVMDNGEFRAEEATFVNTGKRLITAIFNQARYQDWVRVETVNQQVMQFDAEALKLLDLIEGGVLTPSALAGTSGILLGIVYPDSNDRTAAQERLKVQFGAEYTRLGGGGANPSTADEWIRSIAVLEKLLGVPDYDIMKVHAISASDDELAGSSLLYFGGFFDQQYRQHDYDMGRKKAQEFLAEINAVAASAAPGSAPTLGPIRYTPDANAIPRPDPQFDCVDVTELSATLRRKLRDQISNRVDLALEDLGINAVERLAIDAAVITPKLNEFLGL